MKKILTFFVFLAMSVVSANAAVMDAAEDLQQAKDSLATIMATVTEEQLEDAKIKLAYENAEAAMESDDVEVVNNAITELLDALSGCGSLKGDVNVDGEIDSVDYALLIQKIIGSQFSSDQVFCEPNADINSDGEIDSVDYALLINLITTGK